VFLVDVDGRADQPGAAAEAVDALAAHCGDVRVLGTYPAAAA
jgi:prephenate dehydratase